MLIPLIIDQKVSNEIERVKNNAEQNVFSLEILKSIKNGEAAPGGDDPKFTLHIPTSFNVVYTHEEQPGNVICRHLSVSLQFSGRLPHPLVVELIMNEFGFVNKKLKNVIWWKEKFGENTTTAINVIEPLDGNYEQMKKHSKENDL